MYAILREESMPCPEVDAAADDILCLELGPVSLAIGTACKRVSIVAVICPTLCLPAWQSIQRSLLAREPYADQTLLASRQYRDFVVIESTLNRHRMVRSYRRRFV